MTTSGQTQGVTHMELEQVMRLIEKVSDSTLTAFCYEAEGVKISMEHGRGTESLPSPEPRQSRPERSGETAAADASSGSEDGPDGPLITSPLVGTFYAAPSEGAEPFVRVGDTVKKGQVVAIVEAMKLMNEIESDYDGVVEEVLAANGEMVDYGRPLFRLR